MIVDARPLVDITQEALKVLLQTLGAVNTIRFLNQFTIGYGNYIEEKEELFGHLTLDEIVNNIKQHRKVTENI